MASFPITKRLLLILALPFLIVGDAIAYVARSVADLSIRAMRLIAEPAGIHHTQLATADTSPSWLTPNHRQHTSASAFLSQMARAGFGDGASAGRRGRARITCAPA